jgi:hypothetical protein
LGLNSKARAKSRSVESFISTTAIHVKEKVYLETHIKHAIGLREKNGNKDQKSCQPSTNNGDGNAYIASGLLSFHSPHP